MEIVAYSTKRWLQFYVQSHFEQKRDSSVTLQVVDFLIQYLTLNLIFYFRAR